MRFLLTLIAPALIATAGAPAPLAVGTPLPVIRGELLSGARLELPAAVRGRVTLLAFGFTRGSSADVGAWAARFAARYGTDSTRTWIEVPVMGGMAGLMRGMITGAMRGGTAPADRPHVMPSWGVAGEWKRRLGYDRPRPAYLALLDREGVVRWRGVGPLDDAKWKALSAATETLR